MVGSLNLVDMDSDAEDAEVVQEPEKAPAQLLREKITQKRWDLRQRILSDINLDESLIGADDDVFEEELYCPWRVQESNAFQVYIEKGREESHEVKLKRTKIPPKKLLEMIGRWVLTLTSSHTHHKSTHHESLSSLVAKERLKSAKGNKATAEVSIYSLIDSTERLSHLPRVSLFSKVCGLASGFELYQGGAKVLVHLIKQCFGSQSTSAERLEDEGNCWLSGDVADSVVNVFFDTNPYWRISKWDDACSFYGVDPPFSDPGLRLGVAAELASLMTTVGEIDAKDRRRLPSDIRGAGITQVVIDADRLMDKMYTHWVVERSRVARELEAAELHRIKLERRMQQDRMQELKAAQDRPFTESEQHYLKKGVLRHGVGSWEQILKDERYVLVYRTKERLEAEWQRIALRRKQREKKRWNWRRWPWNPEWEWGGLKVSEAGLQGASGGFDLWAAIEGQGHVVSDDEEEEELVDSDSTFFSDSEADLEDEEDDALPETEIDEVREGGGQGEEGLGRTFVTQGESNPKKTKGMRPSASAPEIGGSAKPSPYLVKMT